jgi:hypothetical protein
MRGAGGSYLETRSRSQRRGTKSSLCRLDMGKADSQMRYQLRSGLIHQRCLWVRMKMSPSDTASEEVIGSPPMELTARSSKRGAALSTKTSALRFAT